MQTLVGFCKESFNRTYDYLSNKNKRCKVGLKYNSRFEMLIVEPQVSVLVPFLFNILKMISF